MNTDSLYLGADLGGTQLRLAAVRADGALVTDVLSVPTGPAFGTDALTRALAMMIGEIATRTGTGNFNGFGMGISGIVAAGRLTQSDFLPLLNDVTFTDLLRPPAGCPVAVENDARCFAMAETRFGAARGARNVLAITLGTGIGGGVIVDGRLAHGATARAGELFCVPLRGHHLEYFLSGYGIVREYLAATDQAGQGTVIDSAHVADLARQGDAAAREVWQSFGEDLYTTCMTGIAFLDPEIIVIGGSLTRARDLYFDHVLSRLGTFAPRLRLAALDAPGVIGGAALLMP
ncbi:MAG: ROK family protein [Blastocatellia bacterium]